MGGLTATPSNYKSFLNLQGFSAILKCLHCFSSYSFTTLTSFIVLLLSVIISDCLDYQARTDNFLQVDKDHAGNNDLFRFSQACTEH